MQHEPATEADRPRSRISAAFLQDFQKGLVYSPWAEYSFNSSITTDEEQKQFSLEIVEEHRRSLPNSKKSKLVPNFEDLQ